MSGPARALGIEMGLLISVLLDALRQGLRGPWGLKCPGFAPPLALCLSGPVRALGIEISPGITILSAHLSGPVRALGIEISGTERYQSAIGRQGL